MVTTNLWKWSWAPALQSRNMICQIMLSNSSMERKSQCLMTGILSYPEKIQTSQLILIFWSRRLPTRKLLSPLTIHTCSFMDFLLAANILCHLKNFRRLFMIDSGLSDANQNLLHLIFALYIICRMRGRGLFCLSWLKFYLKCNVVHWNITSNSNHVSWHLSDKACMVSSILAHPKFAVYVSYYQEISSDFLFCSFYFVNLDDI